MVFKNVIEMLLRALFNIFYSNHAISVKYPVIKHTFETEYLFCLP